jgi:hypothetical protein
MDHNTNWIEPIVLIGSFIILSFGENKANFCFFIKIAIFAIILYLLILFRETTENFEICYPNSVKTPTIMSYLSKSKGFCMDESGLGMFSDPTNNIEDDTIGKVNCPIPMDTRILAEKSAQTKLKGMCKLPPDYKMY